MFWTPERSRHYGWKDFGVLLVSTLAVIAALLTEWRVVPDQRIPEHFPVWLFFAGALCGLLWFLRVEYRVSLHHALDSRQPLPDPTVQETLGSWWPQASPVGRVVSDYTTARQQLDVLLKEASDLGRRFERLGQALSGHPTRTIIGAREYVDNPSEWDVMPRELLPTIEGVMTLTDDIRHTAQLVEDLRERLILMGRADLVQQPGEFFR